MNLKSLASSILIATSILTMTGCSNTVGETGLTQEELDVKAPSMDIGNTDIIHGNYGDHISYDDKLLFEQMVREMNEDLKSIVFENTDKDYKDIDFSNFKKKYMLTDTTDTNMKDFYKRYKNIFDNYDGKIDNVLTKPSKEYLYDATGGFISRNLFKELFTIVDADDWFKFNYDDVKDNAIKASDLTENDNLFLFVGDKYYEQNLGYFAIGTKDRLKAEGFEIENIDDDKLPLITVTLAYEFDKEYPLIEGTGKERKELGSNSIEILFVKTNDGWKIMFSKFITNSQSNIEILSQEDNYLNQEN